MNTFKFLSVLNIYLLYKNVLAKTSGKIDMEKGSGISCYVYSVTTQLLTHGHILRKHTAGKRDPV